MTVGQEVGSTGESSNWSRWCDDGGGIDGGNWCLADGGHLLNLTVGDLLDERSDDGNRNWRHHSGGLLNLTIDDLSCKSRGGKSQSDDDFLDGRHCDDDGVINGGLIIIC